MAQLFRKAIIAICVLGLSGCATLHQASEHYQKDKAALKRLKHTTASQRQPSVGSPAFESVDMPYFAGSPYARHAQLPKVLDQHVSFSSQSALPIQNILQHISDRTGVNIAIQPAALSWLSGSDGTGSAGGGTQTVKLPGPPGAKKQSVSVKLPSDILPPVANAGNVKLNYQGTLSGLLDNIAGKTGLEWRWKNGRAWVFLTETKTYSVAAIPGSQGISASFSNQGSLKSTSGGGGGRSAGTLTGGASTGVSFSIKKMNLYKSIVSNVKSLLDVYKKNGVPIAVTSNPHAGIIAVTAPPEGQQAVASYIGQINLTMTREVYIGVKIYQISLNRGQNYNFNLSAAFQNALSQYGATLASPTSQVPASGSGQASLFVLKNATGGAAKWSGSKIVGSALASIGTVDNTTSSNVLAMSGQVTPFQHALQQGYLRSSSTTTSANVGSTSSLQQGSVTTGFIGSFFPRVLPHHKILLRYTLVLSANKGFQTITSGNGEIEVPTISSDASSPTVLLHSGDTLVMAGLTSYKGTENHSGTGSAFFWGLGGGADASTARTALVIVLHVVQLGAGHA